MRLAYSSSEAEIEAGAVTVDLIPDPRGNVSTANGLCFREPAALDLATAKSGWMLCDVIAVEPDAIVLVQRSFPNLRGSKGPCTLGRSRAFVVHPTGCEFFVPPAGLQELHRRAGRIAGILEIAIDLDGTQHRALRNTFAIAGDERSSIHDLESGAQLSSSCISRGEDGVTTPPFAASEEPRGATTRVLTSYAYRGARRLELPWRTQELPTWMQKRVLRYYGHRVDTRAPQNGLAVTRTYFRLDYRIQRHGKSFALFEPQITREPDTPTDLASLNEIVACGPGSVDPLWIDPEVLAGLRTGQVIDRDPTTGVEVVVENAGSPIEGGWMVDIRTRGAFTETTRRYWDDGTMVLLEQTARSPSNGTTRYTRLRIEGLQDR